MRYLEALQRCYPECPTGRMLDGLKNGLAPSMGGGSPEDRLNAMADVAYPVAGLSMREIALLLARYWACSQVRTTQQVMYRGEVKAAGDGYRPAKLEYYQAAESMGMSERTFRRRLQAVNAKVVANMERHAEARAA